MNHNAPCPEWDARLSAYQDGELPPRERKAVDAHLAGCAACRGALAQLDADRARFTESYQTDYPDITDAVLQEVRTMSNTNQTIPIGLLRWVAGFSAAALLVSLALVVVLFTGPRRETSPVVVYTPGEQQNIGYDAYSGNRMQILNRVDAKRTASGIAAPHEKGGFDYLDVPRSPAVDRTFTYSPDTGSMLYDAQADRNYGYLGGLKMAYDINYGLLVKNALKSARQGGDVIRNHGGFVIDFNYSGDEGDIPVASVRGKVPAKEAKAAIEELEKMGRITGITLSGEDLTSQFMQYMEEMAKKQKTAENLRRVRDHNRDYVELNAEQARHWAEQQAAENKRAMIGVVTKSSLVELSVTFAESAPKQQFGPAQFLRGMRAVLVILLVTLAVVAVGLLLLALIITPIVLLRRRNRVPAPEAPAETSA